MFGKPAEEEPGRTVGPDVLGPAELLSQESVELGAALPDPLPPGQSNVLNTDHGNQRCAGKDGDSQADDEVLPEEEDEDAEQQNEIAHHVDHELTKEVGEGRHVTVDTLDHFTRSSGLVEAHVQPQAVFGQIPAQFVGCGPSDVLGQVGRDHRQRLLGYGQGSKRERQTNQARLIGSGNSLVDEAPDDLRIDELEGNPREQEHCQQDHPPPVRAQVVHQEIPVLSDGDHRTSFRTNVREG